MKTGLLLLMMACAGIAAAQNLVPNPSFEDTLQCPTTLDNVDGYVKDWTSFGNSPDYFNTCGNAFAGHPSGVPENVFGHQSPADGNAYAGLSPWQWGFPYREFIGVELKQPLVVGTKYFLSFWVSLADTLYTDCPCNHLGGKLTTIEFTKWQTAPLDNHAQVFETSLISNETDWTKVSGSFVADSAYRYLVIGNFFDDAHTDTLGCNDFYVPVSYYYVDAVCLTNDSVVCFVNENVPNTSPVAVQFTQSSSAIQVSFAPGQFERYIIYNALGQVVEMQQLPLSAATASFNTGNLPAAVYVFHLFGNSKNFTRKFLVH